MPLLEKACCCLELATGTAILGWLGAIGSLLNIIGSIIQIADPNIGNGPLIVTLISGICQLIISGLLIRGAMTRNRRLVVPWLIVTIVNLVIVNITFIYLVFETDTFTLLIVLAIVDLIVGYFWSIVYSFHQELEADEGGGAV